MPYRWLPWKYFARRLARRHGFPDPIELLSRVDRLAQPSEVMAPGQLLRAGAAFHARGLMNSRVIQTNLDWVWPYWVQRQFDPRDNSFMPRGFAVSHVNLTHRNWTALGLPDCDAFPIVDPRGLLTPEFDGWSVDAAVLADDGTALFMPLQGDVDQRMETDGDRLSVRTLAEQDDLSLEVVAWVEEGDDGQPVCRMTCSARADRPAWLAVSLRPFNPEGVSPVNEIALDEAGKVWTVDGKPKVRFGRALERHAVSTYEDGDVLPDVLRRPGRRSVKCRAGLATAAALWRVESEHAETAGTQAGVRVPLTEKGPSGKLLTRGKCVSWRSGLEGACRMRVPDEEYQYVYDAAVRSLVLHSPASVYPGPYTYRRFWVRDAAFILNALLGANLIDRVERALDRFKRCQRVNGYFHSQDGEWDANGAALWTFGRFADLTGREPKPEWRKMVEKGARWIRRKRQDTRGGGPHEGLLPAGFSAEHFGNNDYYYWDDLWAVAGLRAAARMIGGSDAEQFAAEANDLMAAVERSITQSPGFLATGGVPASPYRRMDSAAVGGLIAGYPLQLWPPEDARLAGTAEFLMRNCRYWGALFHEVIHSGMNAYLTLHLAQVLLRAGDERCHDLIASICELASPTGQWPEAVHPRTAGGCMGDGQHVWASAEWFMMMRNLFVREEGDGLILASGIPREWLAEDEEMEFGPTPTPWGAVSVQVDVHGAEAEVRWQADWRENAPRVTVKLAGTEPVTVTDGGIGSVTVPTAGD